MDGKHQTVTKIVVEAAVVAPAHQSRGLQLRRGEAALFEQAEESAPIAIGIAEAELFDGFGPDAAAGQIGARDFAGRPGQAGAEILLREFVHLVEGFALAGFLIGILRALGHWNAVALGQALEGFVKAQTFELHDEAHHVALGLAPEAVVELLGGVDRERRSLLLVERAEALIAVDAGLAEPDFFADDADNVDARFQFLDEVHGPWFIIPHCANRYGWQGLRACYRTTLPVVLHLFQFFAARDDFAVTLGPEGRHIVAQCVSTGNGVKDRRAPERGGRTGDECFFRPVPGLANLVYGPRARALGSFALRASGTLFGCGSAALWGSQSWLPPAFSRRLPGAKTPDRGKSRLKEADGKGRPSS